MDFEVTLETVDGKTQIRSTTPEGDRALRTLAEFTQAGTVMAGVLTITNLDPKFTAEKIAEALEAAGYRVTL